MASRKPQKANKTELPSTPPSILNDEAKRIYAHMLPLLRELGCVAMDINTVVSFCDCVSLKHKAMRELAQTGELVQNGAILQASPWLAIKHKQIELEKKLAADLCANPGARHRLSIDIGKASADDQKAALLED